MVDRGFPRGETILHGWGLRPSAPVPKLSRGGGRLGKAMNFPPDSCAISAMVFISCPPFSQMKKPTDHTHTWVWSIGSWLNGAWRLVLVEYSLSVRACTLCTCAANCAPWCPVRPGKVSCHNTGSSTNRSESWAAPYLFVYAVFRVYRGGFGFFSMPRARFDDVSEYPQISDLSR